MLGAIIASTAAAAPKAAPPTAAIPAAEDIDYPGVITVNVDASDYARHILSVHETLPVAGPGAITLLFPKWLPGEHAATGPIAQMAGLTISANGKRLAWQRDPVEMTAFHLRVPEGVKALDIDMQRLAMSEERFAGSPITANIVAINWNSLSLYPAGYAVNRLPVKPSIVLPANWRFVSGLDGASRQGDKVVFAVTNYETLIDSPLYAGKYTKTFDLDPGAAIPVRLTALADHEEDLEAKPEIVELHRNLVRQAYRLFKSRHYDHYDFILALNDKMSDLGIEHHRSSENGYTPRYFTDWDGLFADHSLLPHEFSHSWNGKFRRPADLWNDDYNKPMRGSLLWVYEGQTEYWSWVLSARAGLMKKPEILDALAAYAASDDAMLGRQWRDLQDTTNGEMLGLRGMRSYGNWVRGLDYYVEGALIWLDVDTLIREKSDGKKSLDDFAQAFFAIDDGVMTPNTYRFDDVVAALNNVLPYDWAGFLRNRLDGHGPGGPLDGVSRGGYRVQFSEIPNSFLLSQDLENRTVSVRYSIGLAVGHDGQVIDVVWNSPAFKAGLIPGAQIIAVNSYPYDGEILKTAIREAKTATTPIELLIKADDRYRMVLVDYHGGLRHPHLEPLEGRTPLLDQIFQPK